MPNWSKEDSEHFAKSEVMKEFESNIIKTLNRVAILNDKIAQQMPISKDISEGTKKLDEFNRKLDVTVQKLKNLADDDMEEEDSDDVSVKAKAEILDELRKMADKAISEGKIKIAYDIERTIDELNEVEVSCD